MKTHVLIVATEIEAAWHRRARALDLTDPSTQAYRVAENSFFAGAIKVMEMVGTPTPLAWIRNSLCERPIATPEPPVKPTKP